MWARPAVSSEIPFLEKDSVSRKVLPNGMILVTQEDHRHPIVSVSFYVRAGGLTENASCSGLSHLSEHLFFRGSINMPGSRMKRELQNMGARTNAETTKDYTRYYATFPSDCTERILKILSDALIYPAMDPKEFDQERKVVIEEFRISQDQVGSILPQKLYETAYQSHPYGLPLIGTEKNLRSFTLADFQEYRARYYVPQNVVMVVVGDFNTSSLEPFILELFNDFKAASSPPSFPDPEYPGKEVREVKLEKHINNVYFIMGYPAPSSAEMRDVYSMDLITFMLGKGRASFFGRMMSGENGGIARSLNVDFLTQRNPGLLMISAEVAPENTEKVRQAVNGDLEDIKAGRFSDGDLQRARGLLITTFITGLESVEGRASTCGFYETIAGLDVLWGYLDGIRAVDRKELIRVARQYFGQNYTYIAILPSKEGGH
jgi:zinc protease